jgi:DNA-binding NarL/FixJ family response regulator
MGQTRVVIADDESIIRMDLKEMLTGLGYLVVGEAGDRVLLLGFAAFAMSAKIDRYDAMALGEILLLRREVGMIAGPSVHENNRRRAPSAHVVVKLDPVTNQIFHRVISPRFSGDKVMAAARAVTRRSRRVVSPEGIEETLR